MSLAARTRRLLDQLTNAQHSTKSSTSRSRPVTAYRTTRPIGPPDVDWQAIQDQRGKGRLAQLVITAAVDDEVPVDEMPDLEDVVRQDQET
jgi:hypothetical protein